ncbi:MAG: prephenate dehydrogenase [Flavobacterium sp.]|jgi:prephenate dehydrogenase
MTFDRPKVAIIGLGLIGGSIALGLKSLGCRVHAFDQNESSLRSGLDSKVIDVACGTIELVIKDVELIIVAVPVLAMSEVFTEISPVFNDKKIIVTDVGSVKAASEKALIDVYGSVPRNFVLGHPIAGSEKHGVTASNADLFQHHQVILAPNETTSPVCTQYVKSMWQSLGANVTEMSVEHHDRILAQTSHLPHLLAFALIDTLSQQGDSVEVFDFAAGGLRDFSRIAASDPRMWGDIFESNSGPLIEILDQYLDQLKDLRGRIEAGDVGEVFQVLERSKQARDHFSTILEQRSAGNQSKMRP